MHRSLTSRPALAVVLTSIVFLIGASSAFAACGDPMGSRNLSPLKLPPSNAISSSSRVPSTSIVGLWHVTYSSQGALFYEAFDQWHSDGTEFENADVTPTIGNVCLGVWTQKGSTITLSHIGWNFDTTGNPIGTFTLNEKNVVNGSTYRGTFDYKVFDVNGNMILEITGTQTATRIAVSG